ncbi:hypothetical protein SDC9_206422 [bioreactor metagenome]|uniref:Uncharacterized protein n=1 Tax=bioreactor metagenome TaxID=1076179 RepID=A0A645J6E7_9ZZZZ
MSAAVVNTWLFLAGMVVLRSMSLVMTPPMVSMPRDRGVTSSSSRPFTSPTRTPPWMAAPMATHSSGLMPLKPSLLVSFLTMSCTAGIRVEPPTSRTLDRSLGCRPASLMACFTGPLVASTSWAVSSLNLARVRVRSRCLGPVASAVI